MSFSFKILFKDDSRFSPLRLMEFILFVFLQIIAGIVIIQTQTELLKRASIFISVSQIVFIYLLGYFAFSIIHEGNLETLKLYRKYNSPVYLLAQDR